MEVLHAEWEAPLTEPVNLIMKYPTPHSFALSIVIEAVITISIFRFGISIFITGVAETPSFALYISISPAGANIPPRNLSFSMIFCSIVPAYYTRTRSSLNTLTFCPSY